MPDKRHSVIEEIVWWIYTRGFDPTNGGEFIKKTIQSGFNHDILLQTSCMLTKRMDDVLNIFYLVDKMENECSVHGPYRDDQTILSFVIGTHYYRWNGLNLMNFEKICQNPYFSWRQHGRDDFKVEAQQSFRCFDMDFGHLYEIGDDFNRNFFE